MLELCYSSYASTNVHTCNATIGLSSLLGIAGFERICAVSNLSLLILSLLNLSLLNLREKVEVERTFRIHANEDDDHLVQGGAVNLIT